MSYALNEVEALAKRAVRGAGMSWGTAEEAAKATCLLCRKGIDGAGVLSALLRQNAGKGEQDLRPVATTGLWQTADGGPLCPLLSGATLSDCAVALKDAPISMQNLSFPALLLPFLASAAAQLGCTLTLECDAGTGSTDGNGLALSGEGFLQVKSADVVIRIGDLSGEILSQDSRATPAPEAWDTLNTYAHKTYAPATEASRLAGAGAGLSDND
ncbi:DUF3726 domain-containing protein [Thalassobius sp. I31.1]|uniref:DUF3726 domain-containing protein n=1 Tax=Thalassobius sp. I31.1 TaxID=2109912 RepID=UPI000D19CB44|nr:DUF3726 domain-containing protein [Thalassobius sp. I31.1]